MTQGENGAVPDAIRFEHIQRLDNVSRPARVRVFAGMNHFGQPVERRVRVAPAHRLDECRNCVIVRVFAAVVHHRLFLNALLRDGKIKRNSDYWDMVTFLKQIGLMQ